MPVLQIMVLQMLVLHSIFVILQGSFICSLLSRNKKFDISSAYNNGLLGVALKNCVHGVTSFVNHVRMRTYQFWTYILTNFNRTVLYTGVTNNLSRRLVEHWIGSEGAFTSRYKVYYLLFAEETKYVLNAIDREKEIKLLNRARKEALITSQNPEWTFLNESVLGNWPPTDAQVKDVLAFWDAQLILGEQDGLFFHRQLRSEKLDEPNGDIY